MRKLCVLDVYEAKGHIALNRFFLNKLMGYYSITLLGSKGFADNYNDMEISVINTVPFGFANKIIFRVYSFYILLMAVFYGIKNPGSKLLILSYEEITFSLFSKLLCMIFYDVSCFEHATIPNKGSHKLKKLSFGFISRKVVHLVFEEYMAIFLRETFYKQAKVVFHPCLLECANNDSLEDNIISVFCPSGGVSAEFHEKIAKHAEIYKSFFYYGKACSDEIKGSKYFLLKKYYDNYNDVFCGSDIIIFPLTYDYRVSGVFYEALSKSKIVFMRDSIFSRFCLNRYGGEFVKLYSSEEELFILLSSASEIKKNQTHYDVKLHNSKSLDALMSVYK